MDLKKIKIGNLVNTWSFINVREDINYHFIIFDFEFFTDESKIKLSDEHTEYKWIGVEGLDKFEMRGGYKESIRKYFNEKQN